MDAFSIADTGMLLHVMPHYEYLMFGIIYIFIPLIAVVHIIRSRFKWLAAKVLWLFVVVTMPVVGVVLYLMAGHSSRNLSARTTAITG
jgi:hypothetical protein